MHYDGSKERKGSAGRIPDKVSKEHIPFDKMNVSIDHPTYERMVKYCEDEERARSWVIQKALQMWLASKGY